MDNVKPWQIVLIIAAIGALGFSVVKYGFKPSQESQMANTLTLVDVQTGQLYIADISGKRTIIIPARNPDNDEVALIPVFEENGEWFIWNRYKSAMSQVTVTPEAVPDTDGAVVVLDESPIRLK